MYISYESIKKSLQIVQLENMYTHIIFHLYTSSTNGKDPETEKNTVPVFYTKGNPHYIQFSTLEGNGS